MGCVPSRCLYCTSSSNGRAHGSSRMPLLRSVSTPLRKRKSRGYVGHHHHFVALTSTTYGLLRWNSNSSSSPGLTTQTEDESRGEDTIMTPMEKQQPAASQETPFFDTGSATTYEDCYTCTDKEVVVGVVQSGSRNRPSDCETCLDVSGAPSISSSSSCVNKLVNLDDLQQQLAKQGEPEVINIWELMQGLEDDCSRSLLTPCCSSPASPSRRKKSPLSARHCGKRRLYHRSVSLSAIQAAKKLDSVLTVDGISPSTLERLLKEIYNYYVSSRSRNRLTKPLSASSPSSPVAKNLQSDTPKKPKKSSLAFGDKENSAPKFDRSPVCFDKNLFSSKRRKNRSTPIRNRASLDKVSGFSFSFFTGSKLDYDDRRPSTPPPVRKQQPGMGTPRTPLSPVVVKTREDSPLFRGVLRSSNNNNNKSNVPDNAAGDAQKSSPPPCCCMCSCCNQGQSIKRSQRCQKVGGDLKSSSCCSVGNRSSSGALFDPELLASIERAFQSLSAEDWYSSKEDLAADDSSSIEEVPLMGSKGPPRSGGKCSATPNSGSSLGLWDSFWSFRDSFTASGTAKKISFSKVSPLALQDPKNEASLFHGDEEEEEEKRDVLDGFEIRCPPGGESSVVLYCTSLRGIRKTFEECHSLQMILRNLGVCIDERDVSMHSDFRLELKELLDDEPTAACVPRLFIKGRYIGGAEEVKKLHEEGRLVKMLEGIPKEDPFSVCDGCGGLRFIPCLECSGSCKLVLCEKGGNQVTRCPDCNENGLIRCPICC